MIGLRGGWAGALRRLRREQRGLTIVEGAVAGLLLVIGSLGVLQVFDSATRNNFRAEESQVVVNRLQAELEEVKRLDYEAVALAAAPSDSTDENDPRWRINGSQYAINATGMDFKPLVIDAAKGAISPAPEPFQSGDVTGQIFKFVVWRDDPSCAEALCPGAQDLKRVIVAARIDEAPASFDRAYQEIHTEVADPESEPLDNPGPPDDTDQPFVAQFWLTDTPCTQATRQPITADHPAHNTRGRCVDGAHTGSTTPGAPDLMLLEAPALDPDYAPDEQPIYDYATDSEQANPPADAPDDKGLLMPSSSLESCILEPVLGLPNIRSLLEDLLAPLPQTPGPLHGLLDDLDTADPNKYLRVHTWLSPKVSGSGGVLTGEGTLELWTKTVGEPLGASHPGEICVEVFIRQTVQVPVRICVVACLPIEEVNLEVDVPVVNTDGLTEPLDPGALLDPARTHFLYGQNPWPRQFERIILPLEFVGVDTTGAPVPVVLTPGSQVGMSLMVRGAGSGNNGLEFIYDHPSFESKLNLKTNVQVPFGGGI